MKTKIWLALAAASLLAASLAGAEEIAGLPLHVQKIGDGAIRVWIGDHISSTSIVAFATEKGIVVVDTFGVPKIDAELRDVIARELGRNDFTFLINTHEHADHTGGNSVYADCTIVGHELIADGLSEIAERRGLGASLDQTLVAYGQFILKNQFQELRVGQLVSGGFFAPHIQGLTQAREPQFSQSTLESFVHGGVSFC